MVEKISCLIALQNRSSFYIPCQPPGGFNSLLSNCFELHADANTTVLLSGCDDHFQSLRSEDVGWLKDCLGKKVLMPLALIISTIPSMVLDIGLELLNVLPLLALLALRARIVDFGPEELQSFFLSVPSTSLPSPLMTTNARGKRKASQVYGPMDSYLLGRNCDVSQLESAVNDMSRSSTNKKAGGSDYSVANKFPRKNEGHRALLDGIPLYYQHDGHSITIVGIQVRRQENKVLQYNLLILDPAHLCPIDPGIANGQEMEQLKKIDGVFIAF
ncbi:hypothetical protein POTOM_048879 [Populus tomentosa]|uniref:Uncharacterized protein n=1 Tax=Populus tomentosa TaxID=118781 RepID=A0A8X7Y4V5_POPTO|nr:hypothetical protein POTOM_048879 [Populus tomentosa]